MMYQVIWHWKDGDTSIYPPFLNLREALNFIQKDKEFRPDLNHEKDIDVHKFTVKVEIVFVEGKKKEF